MDETQERKQEELGADEETPVKITATKTDSESEDSFPIQPVLKYPVGKKIQWINILQFLLAVLQTHPQALLHLPLIKSTYPEVSLRPLSCVQSPLISNGRTHTGRLVECTHLTPTRNHSLTIVTTTFYGT